jgi:hypothetical protein
MSTIFLHLAFNFNVDSPKKTPKMVTIQEQHSNNNGLLTLQQHNAEKLNVDISKVNNVSENNLNGSIKNV